MLVTSNKSQNMTITATDTDFYFHLRGPDHFFHDCFVGTAGTTNWISTTYTDGLARVM